MNGRVLRTMALRISLYWGTRSTRPSRISRAIVCISIVNCRSVRSCNASGVLSAMSVSSTRRRCSRRIRRYVVFQNVFPRRCTASSTDHGR